MFGCCFSWVCDFAVGDVGGCYDCGLGALFWGAWVWVLCLVGGLACLVDCW